MKRMTREEMVREFLAINADLDSRPGPKLLRLAPGVKAQVSSDAWVFGKAVARETLHVHRVDSSRPDET